MGISFLQVWDLLYEIAKYLGLFGLSLGVIIGVAWNTPDGHFDLKRFLVGLVIYAGMVGVLLFPKIFPDEEANFKPFFEIILSGNPTLVVDQIKRRTRSYVDPQILEVWLKVLKETYGNYAKVIRPDYPTSTTRSQFDDMVTWCRGKVQLEKGDAHLFLERRDGVISEFELTLPKFPRDWGRGVKTAFFRKRGSEFISAFFGRSAPAAYSLFFQYAEKPATMQDMQESIDNVCGRYGALMGLDFRSERYFEENGRQVIEMVFSIIGESQTGQATLRFEFGSWRGPGFFPYVDYEPNKEMGIMKDFGTFKGYLTAFSFAP